MRRAWLVTVALLAVRGVSAQAQPGDWSVQRDPFDRTLISRYKAILSRTPHDRMALSALVSLYKRHRTIDLLVHEYEAAAGATGDGAGLVVLARLARSRGDNPRARGLLNRAVVLRPDDPAAWLALGELAIAASDHEPARIAFTEAAARAKDPATKRAALHALVPLLIAAKNVPAIEQVFDDLAALRPRDGLLWTERGDALLEMAKFHAALAAYAKAEALFARDPERKLLAISARGRTFERAGDSVEAIAEYDRAIAASPRGYYLRRELTLRIVELIRRGSIDRAVAELERRWPEAQRDAFEWSTLADFYEKSGEPVKQLDALRAAAKKAPRDTVMQWKLIRHLDRLQRPADALATLEAAVKALPKDLALVLELAQRLVLSNNDEDIDYDDDTAPDPDIAAARATRLLANLSRAHPRDADAHAAIGEVYARWKDTAGALRELKLAAKLEPDDDRLVALGDAYAEDDKRDDAILTWRRLAASGTAKGLARLAAVLADHQMWDDAIGAYGAAMMAAPKNFALWRGRALALAEIDAWYSAITDAEYAITLMGPMSFDPGYETRVVLVDILDRRLRAGDEDTFGEATDGYAALREHLVAWGKAFRQPHPDIAAGYMLAAYFARHRSTSLVPILLKLQTLVPADEGVVVELIRAYRLEHRYDDAVAVARGLAAKRPARATEMNKLVASIEIDRKHHRQEELENAAEIEDNDEPARTSNAWVQRGGPHRIPLVAGVRIGLGVGLGGATDQTLTIGSWDAVPITKRLDVIVRADWTQHVGQMRSTNAVAAGLGIARHAIATTNTAVMVAAGLRAERRLWDQPAGSPWERWGFAVDAGVDVTSRHLPATIGLRWEQSLGDPARGSTVLFELAVGLRCLDLRLSGGSGACR